MSDFHSRFEQENSTSHIFPFFVFLFFFNLTYLWRCLTSDRSKRIHTFSHSMDWIWLESFTLWFWVSSSYCYISYTDKLLFKILCHVMHYLTYWHRTSKSFIDTRRRFFFTLLFPRPSDLYSNNSPLLHQHKHFLNLCIKDKQFIYATESPDSLLGPQLNPIIDRAKERYN